jgi:mono/diheme cytochrome c family protein
MRQARANGWRGLLAAAGLATAGGAWAADTWVELAPLLAQRCVVCHAGEAAPLGLRLDTYEALLRGSTRGPVVRAGAPAESELIRRLQGTSLPRMPMTGPPYLAEAEVARFGRWIAAGLPRGETPPMTAVSAANPGPTRPAGGPLTYLDVAPIFATRCAKCHTDRGSMGPPPEGFRLNSYAATLAADERARVVPGSPGASELVRRIRGQSLPRMPFDGPPYLSETEIRLIEQWIADGARDAEGRPAPVPEGAAVRLHGTLGPGGQLDGLDLAIGRRTRIDKSPRPGDYVQVRGRVDAEGRVIVDRLRRR